MSCDYWIYRDGECTKVLVEEFGYFYSYTLIENRYFLEAYLEIFTASKDYKSYSISELEFDLVMKILFEDRDNRLNIAYEIGLKAG